MITAYFGRKAYASYSTDKTFDRLSLGNDDDDDRVSMLDVDVPVQSAGPRFIYAQSKQMGTRA